MKTYLVEIATTDRVDVRTVLVSAQSVTGVVDLLSSDPEFKKRYRVDQINSVEAIKPSQVIWL